MGQRRMIKIRIFSEHVTGNTSIDIHSPGMREQLVGVRQEYKPVTPQRACGVYRTSNPRRCNVMTKHRCKRDILFINYLSVVYIQSTLVISNSKGLSEILRDIRTSTYQICRIEEKIIRLTTFNKYTCNWTLEVRDILKILWKRGEIAP